MNRSPSHARTSPSFGRLKYFFGDCDLEAVVSQANGKPLRYSVHSDFNRLSTAGHLCCADVAPRGSIDCYRAVAAAGRRAGCAGSQTAGATLARIRLSARLSATTE